MLSSIFRAKMRAAVERAGLAADIDPAVWKRRWTVHVKAIGNGQHAALYLSRYVYRVALTNQRIERFQDGRVTFRYTHAHTGETRRLTLPANVFIARFLQHVLPRGFTKVRSYGLMSPASKPHLERARSLLQLHSAQTGVNTPPDDQVLNSGDSAPDLALTPDLRCPVCHRGHLQLVERFQRSRAPPLLWTTDPHTLLLAPAAA
jgi:hypothetical protein